MSREASPSVVGREASPSVAGRESSPSVAGDNVRGWRSGSVLKKGEEKATVARGVFIQDENKFVMEEIANWLTAVGRRQVSSDIRKDLATGEALCEVVNLIDSKQKLTYHTNVTPGTFQARENVEMFQKRCRELGVSETFNYTDLSYGSLKPVLACLYDLARCAIKYGVRPPSSLNLDEEWKKIEAERLERERLAAEAAERERRRKEEEDAMRAPAPQKLEEPLLPHPSSSDDDESNLPWYSRRWAKFLFCFLILVLIAAGIIVVIELTAKPDKH